MPITKEFTSPIFQQPEGTPLGEHKGTVTVELPTSERGGKGWFELEIPDIDTVEEGGLWAQRNDEGKMALTDYDGVHVISDVVLDILTENGFIVGDEFR